MEGQTGGGVDWLADLERRSRLATPADTARGLFFSGMLSSIEALGDAALAKRCLEVSGQTAFIEFFSYPISLYVRMVSSALGMLAQRYGSGEEALRRIGGHATKSFLESTAGRSHLVVSGGSPRRIVEALPVTYRVSTTFGERRVEWTSHQSGRLVGKREFLPYPFHEGVLLAVLEATGAQGVQVRGRATSELDCECEFSWTHTGGTAR
ncbi:MAG TPA: TIGR02265 family protein [Archangium sp.]